MNGLEKRWRTGWASVFTGCFYLSAEAGPYFCWSRPCLILAETVVFSGYRCHFIRDIWTDGSPWRPAPPIPHTENRGLISIVPWARNRHVQSNHLPYEDLSRAILRRHLLISYGGVSQSGSDWIKRVINHFASLGWRRHLWDTLIIHRSETNAGHTPSNSRLLLPRCWSSETHLQTLAYQCLTNSSVSTFLMWQNFH